MKLLNKLRYKLSGFRLHDQNPDLKLCYTDKKGNAYYCMTNPAIIPAQRALAAWVVSKDAEFGLSREKMKLCLDKAKKALNKSDIVEASQAIGIIESAMDLYAESEILLQLATCYIFLNDENPKEYSNEVQKKKRKLWDEDAEAKSFFLQFAYRLTRRYGEQPQLNVREYLEKVSPVLKELEFYLTKK